MPGRLSAEHSKKLAYAGPVPAAPLNRIVMLTDYVAPATFCSCHAASPAIKEPLVANYPVAELGDSGQYVCAEIK